MVCAYPECVSGIRQYAADSHSARKIVVTGGPYCSQDIAALVQNGQTFVPGADPKVFRAILYDVRYMNLCQIVLKIEKTGR